MFFLFIYIDLIIDLESEVNDVTIGSRLKIISSLPLSDRGNQKLQV